jgi:hypothetical protein
VEAEDALGSAIDEELGESVSNGCVQGGDQAQGLGVVSLEGGDSGEREVVVHPGPSILYSAVLVGLMQGVCQVAVIQITGDI